MHPSRDQAIFLVWGQRGGQSLHMGHHLLAAAQQAHLIETLGKPLGRGRRRQTQREGVGFAEEVVHIDAVLHDQRHAGGRQLLTNRIMQGHNGSPAWQHRSDVDIPGCG